MKIFTISVLITAFINTSGQVIAGKYRDYFGRSLHLREDSTFREEWGFDLIRTWSIGKWRATGRTISMGFESVFDTLAREGKPDSLVLSIDETSNQINEEEFLASLLVSGGQVANLLGGKRFLKGKRLYAVNRNGKIIRKRFPGNLPQKRWLLGYKKRWPSWYIRDKDSINFNSAFHSLEIATPEAGSR